jgi:hypothetical protein
MPEALVLPLTILAWIGVGLVVVGLCAAPFYALWFWRQRREFETEHARTKQWIDERGKEIRRGATSGLPRFKP